MPGAAIISFRPIGALAALEIKRRPSPSIIVLDLELERGERVNTPQGEDLGQLDWKLQLNRHEAVSDRPEHADSVGLLMHLDSGTCFIKVAAGEAMFDRLMLALQAGRMPRRISVEVKGLSYGLAPDGSAKLWDVRKNDSAVVTEVSFTLPIGAATEDLEPGDSAVSPTSADVRAARREIGRELERLRGVVSLAVGLLCILVLLVGWQVLWR